jgi:hypothetical protein
MLLFGPATTWRGFFLVLVFWFLLGVLSWFRGKAF